MKYSRSLFSFSFSFFLLTSTAHCEVFALTVKQEVRQINTCRDLQDEANRKKWSKQTIFQGFENLQVDTDPYGLSKHGVGDGKDRLCQLGYITTISPMGKEICKGNLYTNVGSRNRSISWGYGYKSTDVYGSRYKRSDFCRYVN
jgi:hypothetical protein